MANDYYQVLGVDRSASEADIKKAYRKLSKEWHPDKHKGDKGAEAKFKEINEAYEVLGNANRKKQYDQFGAAGGASGQGGFDFSGFQQGDFNGFGDIFESFFGGGAGQRSRRPSNRGGDLQVRIAIDFADVVQGAQKTISIEKMQSCETCNGSGDEGGKRVTCTECNGTGQIVRTAQSFFGTIQQSVVCPQCEGEGQVPENPCKTCRGEGRVRSKAQMTIDIPAGIDDGQTLRVHGQGDAGKHGGESGDLFVVVQVVPDKRFAREGTDIRSTVTISVLDAILGTEVQVPTVHGDVTLKVPAGTQPQQIMRLKGKGLPLLNTSRMGDHYVTVIIDIPKSLSRKEKKLMEEWGEMLK